MTLTVVDFKKPIESGENVVSMLEQMLVLAREGQVINFFGVALLRQDATVGGWANTNQPFTMLGCVESMKLDFAEKAIER